MEHPAVPCGCHLARTGWNSDGPVHHARRNALYRRRQRFAVVDAVPHVPNAGSVPYAKRWLDRHSGCSESTNLTDPDYARLADRFDTRMPWVFLYSECCGFSSVADGLGDLSVGDADFDRADEYVRAVKGET